MRVNFLPKIFILYLILFLLVSFLGFYLLEPNFLISKVEFFQNFSNWDAGYFLSVAQNGYTKISEYAFFPLFPLILHTLSFNSINPLLVSMVINLVLTFLGFWIFYQLLNLDFSERFSRKTLIWLLIFPSSFYFFLPYSESLFFVLSLAAFYFYRRKKFLWSALFASLSSITRLAGLIVILSLVLGVFFDQSFKKEKGKFLLLLSPILFIIFCLYLKFNTGNPFYFLVAEENWQRILSLPGISLINSLNEILKNGQLNLNTLVNYFLTVLALGLSFRSLKKQRFVYGIYFLLSVLLPVLSNQLTSMARFLLPVFPLFISFTQIEEKLDSKISKSIFGIMRATFIILQIIYIIAFFNGYGVN